MQTSKVVSLKGWKCSCPHCGHIIMAVNCCACGAFSYFDFFKKFLLKYSLPLLALFSWAKWVHYSNKLTQVREDYYLAREERKKLEAQLQELEFREGQVLTARESSNSLCSQPPPQGMPPNLMEKRLHCEVDTLRNSITRNETEANNLRCQRGQLREDLEEAKRVLEKSANNFERNKKAINYSNYDIDCVESCDNMNSIDEVQDDVDFSKCVCCQKDISGCDCLSNET